MHTKHHHAALFFATAALLASGLTEAGAQVVKTINSLPARILKPGHYALKKNLVLTKTATAAISIEADDVSIDLGGFLITNTLPAGTDVTGIYAQSHGGLAVSHGTVRGFDTGVRLNGNQAAVTGVAVENLRVEKSGATGIQLLGPIGSAKNCVITNTGTPASYNAMSLVLDLGFGTIIGNDIIGTQATPGQQAVGIQCGLQAGVIENNRVLNDQSTRGTTGMFLAFSASYLVENNRVTGFATGINFTNTGAPKYRNNFVTDCTIPYSGGTDSGNNK